MLSVDMARAGGGCWLVTSPTSLNFSVDKDDCVVDCMVVVGNHWYHLKLRFFFEKPFKIFSYKRTASWTTVNQTMHGRSCCSDSELPNVASGNTKGDNKHRTLANHLLVPLLAKF